MMPDTCGGTSVTFHIVAGVAKNGDRVIAGTRTPGIRINQERTVLDVEISGMFHQYRIVVVVGRFVVPEGNGEGGRGGV